MSIEYTFAQMFAAAQSALGEGNQLAAEGITRLMAVHYPHETELVCDLLRIRSDA